MTYVAAYVTALVIFAVVDFVWLSTMSPRFYRPILGDLLAADFRLAPAVVFYLFYPVGLVIFAVMPALKTGDLKAALVLGGLCGLFAYGTYDLTNQATLRNWSTMLTLVDVAWGASLSALVAGAAFWMSAKTG